MAPPWRRVAVVAALVTGAAVLTISRHATSKDTATAVNISRLRQDASMMVAGIDADRRSLTLAASSGDTVAQRDAEASLRAHVQRLTADLAQLDAAGDHTSGVVRAADSTDANVERLAAAAAAARRP